MLRVCALIAALWAGGAQADAVSRLFPSGGLRGQADFTFLGARIYGAELFTGGGGAYRAGRPVALRLTYYRQITSGQFLRSTMSELARIEGARADHAEIRAKLSGCFQNVGSGDTYVAYSSGASDLRLLRNGRETCRVSHAGIGSRFLDIWLSDQSRSPRLTRQLRGG